ncbi:MAG: transporter related protein [Labilithrix sp.]|nr:transporter related protein [Labilithrix sp.]
MASTLARGTRAGQVASQLVLSSALVSAVAATGPEPLLVAEDLRVDIDGVPACDGISFRTQGTHVLVLGAPRALFEATTGLAAVVRGALAVRGIAARQAATRGIVAGAAKDPPVPPRWTVTEYVEWSARLAGVPSALAKANAEEAIAKLQLGTMAKGELARLVPHARRATVVAAALATRAEAIVLDDPLGGLPDEAAIAFGQVLTAALAGRPFVVFAPRMPLDSPLARAADEAIVTSALRVEAQGAPAELAAANRRFVARMNGPVDAALPLLASRGATVEVSGTPGTPGSHFCVDLGRDLSARELIEICDAANVSVVELVPAFRAFT